MPTSLENYIQNNDIAMIRMQLQNNNFSLEDLELLYKSFKDTPNSYLLIDITYVVMQGSDDGAKKYILEQHFDIFKEVLITINKNELGHDAFKNFIPKTADAAVNFIKNFTQGMVLQNHHDKETFAIIGLVHKYLIIPAINIICNSTSDESDALLAYSKFIYSADVFGGGKWLLNCDTVFKKLLAICNINKQDEIGNTAAHWIAPINFSIAGEMLSDLYIKGADFTLNNNSGSNVEDRLSIEPFKIYIDLINDEERKRLLEDAIAKNMLERINCLLTPSYLKSYDINQVEELWFNFLNAEFPSRYYDSHKIIIARLLTYPSKWSNFKLMQGSQSLWLRFTPKTLVDLVIHFTSQDARFLNAWLEVYKDYSNYDPTFVAKIAYFLCLNIFPGYRLFSLEPFSHNDVEILKFIVQHGSYNGSNWLLKFFDKNFDEKFAVNFNDIYAKQTLRIFLDYLPGQDITILEHAVYANRIEMVFNLFKYKYDLGLQHADFEQVAERTLRILATRYSTDSLEKNTTNYKIYLDLLKYLNSFWFGIEATLAKRVRSWSNPTTMTLAYSTTHDSSYVELQNTNEEPKERCCRLLPSFN